MNFQLVPRARLVLALLMLAAGILAASYSWDNIRNHERIERERAFRAASDDIRRAVQDRFATYQQVLLGAVGLFETHGEVSRSQWQTYYRALRLDGNFPGIQGFGFAEAFSATELADHETRIRAEGFSDYVVRPEHPRDWYTAIVYLEPLDWRNLRAFGYDMFSEETRQEAMLRAMQTGQPALSGAVTLLQETESDQQYGTLLYLPVYRPGLPLDTATQRRAALRGFVHSPFRMNDFMQGTLGSAHRDLRLELFDVSPTGARPRMHQSGPPSCDEVRLGQHDFELGGRRWQIRLCAGSAFFASMHSSSGPVLFGGLLATLFIVGIFLTITLSEARAAQVAREMTAAFEASQARETAIVENSPNAILTVDRAGLINSSNRAASQMFGIARERLIQMPFTALFESAIRDGLEAQLVSLWTSHGLPPRMVLETRGLSSLNQLFDVELALGLMGADQTDSIIVLISDVSERRQAERRYREENQLRKEILRNSPVSIITTDTLGIINSLNPAAEHLLQRRESDTCDQLSIAEIFGDPADARQSVGALPRGVLRALFANAREVDGSEIEIRYRQLDGQEVDVSQSVTPLFGDDHELTGYLVVAHDITKRKSDAAMIEHMAHHDALTELPNRILLEQEICEAIEAAAGKGGKVGLLMLDLDHFKRINDSLGHEIGDRLLVEIAVRLNGCLRKRDTVARTGGDEFVIVVPDAEDFQVVSQVARKIIESVSQPVTIESQELHVTPSIGISMFPDHGHDYPTLLKNADIAMYTAKDSGRGTFRSFDEDLRKSLEDRVTLEAELRNARLHDEFGVHLQPLVAIGDGRIIAAEALLRWLPTNREPISPDVFVPIMEETGDILEIGSWVLAQSCFEASRIRREFDPHFEISVNVSPRQFWRRSMFEEVRKTLTAYQLEPDALTLEITEGVLVKDYAEVADMLRELRDFGVNIAVDDFGTGYSSLSYLTKFPINVLKIDRSFIRNITVDKNDASVVSAIIAMAHSLRLTIVAEGIETPEQLAFLRERGCDKGQGYLFGRAQPAAELFASLTGSLREGLEPLPDVASLA